MNDEIVADVEITVDTDDATNDIDAASDAFDDEQTSKGWDVDVQGTNCLRNQLFCKTFTDQQVHPRVPVLQHRLNQQHRSAV